MPEPPRLPITIIDYDARWPSMFETEKVRIVEAIGERATDIQHVGSTAVPGLASKPLIDIMVALRSMADANECIAPLQALGYTSRGEVVFTGGRYYKKIREDGERTHNIHLCEASNPEWERHILFRDCLRNHADVALEYAALKRELAARFPDDWLGYTHAKSHFVEACLAKAGGSPGRELIVASYDERWPALYDEERSRIADALGEWVTDIQHVGSTAVPGLAAKPIIDIMVAIRREADMARCITPLFRSGYECLGEYGIPGRIFFRKRTDSPRAGQTHGGVSRTHHLHMFPAGHAEWPRHIHFRDYLRAHPDVARQYQSLKHDLASRLANDMEAYTDAKTDFIRAIEEKAAAAAPSPSLPSVERGEPSTTR